MRCQISWCKKLTCTGTLWQMFYLSEVHSRLWPHTPPPLTHCIRVYSILIHTWSIYSYRPCSSSSSSWNWQTLAAEQPRPGQAVRSVQKPFTEDPASEGSNILVWFGSLCVLPSPWMYCEAHLGTVGVPFYVKWRGRGVLISPVTVP